MIPLFIWWAMGAQVGVQLVGINPQWQGRPLPTGPSLPGDPIAMHLGYVVASLRAAQPQGLDAQQRANRARHLDALERYRARGGFPHNTYRPGRTPVFVDAAGTACAVAWLMQQDGEQALVERITAESNLATIAEMRTTGLRRWQVASGLSLDELALVQPTYDTILWGGVVRFAVGTEPACGRETTGRFEHEGICRGDDIEWRVRADGTILLSGQVHAGRREGTWVAERGGFRSIHRFRAGLLHGREEHFEDGVLLDLTSWRDGRRHGASFRKLRLSGVQHGVWRNGRRHGRFHGRRDRSTWSIPFRDDAPHGPVRLTGPFDDFRFRGRFEGGRPAGTHRVQQRSDVDALLTVLGVPQSIDRRAALRSVLRGGPHRLVGTRPHDRAGRRHGREVWRAPTAGVTRRVDWVADKRHGRDIARLHGRRLHDCGYAHNRRDGRCRLWHPSGALAVDGTYRDGFRDGRWSEFAVDGSPTSIADYRGGRLDGLQRRWFGSGQRVDARYAAGVLESTLRWRAGRLTDEYSRLPGGALTLGWGGDGRIIHHAWQSRVDPPTIEIRDLGVEPRRWVRYRPVPGSTLLRFRQQLRSLPDKRAGHSSWRIDVGAVRGDGLAPVQIHEIDAGERRQREQQNRPLLDALIDPQRRVYALEAGPVWDWSLRDGAWRHPLRPVFPAVPIGPGASWRAVDGRCGWTLLRDEGDRVALRADCGAEQTEVVLHEGDLFPRGRLATRPADSWVLHPGEHDPSRSVDAPPTLPPAKPDSPTRRLGPVLDVIDLPIVD